MTTTEDIYIHIGIISRIKVICIVYTHIHSIKMRCYWLGEIPTSMKVAADSIGMG